MYPWGGFYGKQKGPGIKMPRDHPSGIKFGNKAYRDAIRTAAKRMNQGGVE
tara:strand:+ start:4801 stop:4953 length:153 start_codon:yes stop_codon:yes gene_type:complete